MVLQPNRQLRCSYTPLVSMRVGLGATDAEPRGFDCSTLLTPAARTRKVACNKTISLYNPGLNMPRSLISSWCLNSQFRKHKTARSHLSTTASFLSISSFPKQTSFVLLMSLFWGRGKGRHEEQIIGGFAHCSYWSFTSLSSTIEGREKLKE